MCVEGPARRGVVIDVTESDNALGLLAAFGAWYLSMYRAEPLWRPLVPVKATELTTPTAPSATPASAVASVSVHSSALTSNVQSFGS